MRWILNGPALETFASNPVSVQFFTDTQPYVIQRKGDPVKLPAQWHALPTRVFTSYRSMEKAFASGSVDAQARAVIYDSEAWQFTPAEEQIDPGTYARKAAQLAHAHNLTFIATPATNLARAAAGPAIAAGEKPYDAFIRLRIAAEQARYADVFEIQAQGSEHDTSRFAAFVRAAAEQARAANPRVMVLAGISTNPSGQKVTAADIVRAVQATRNYVDGYWFNVPHPSKYCPKCSEFRPDIAVDVLHALSKHS